jgi:glycosyltransferase involved in cell wall biosynthesis
METLVQAGYSVDIICLKRRGQNRRDTVKGVNVYRIPVEHHRRGLLRYLLEYSTSFFLAAVTLTLLHLRRRYKVIEVDNMPDILVFATIFPKLLGAKVILYIFDNTPEYFAFKHGLGSNHLMIKLLRLGERISIAYADHVIVTQSLAKKVLERHGAPSSKISIVLNVPNEGIFHPAPSPADMRRDGRFRVITHGAIIQNYGIQTLIRAVPLLVDKIPGLQIQVVGEGEYLDELVRIAHNLGIENSVEFTGRVPHEMIPKMISQADVAVVSMLSDLMLPSKLFEYVATAKPAVITALPTMKEYFDDDSVMFYEPDSEQDLTRCILELYLDPAKASSISSRASTLYERYRWSDMKKMYLAVYDSLSA